MTILKRLSLVLWGAVALALVLGAAGLLLFQNFTLEQRVKNVIEPYAQFIAVGSDAAVDFEDPVRAQEILETLKANPDILSAEILLDKGQLLAGFRRPSLEAVLIDTDAKEGIRLQSNRAYWIQSLPNGARLHLVMSLEQLERQTQRQLGLFAAGVLVMVLATWVQLSILKRTIASPIASLTEATEKIRAAADYHHRVQATGSEELVRLGHNFNAMMDTIQERENTLLTVSTFQRTILDNAAYAIISTAPDGTVTSFNAAAERLLGYLAADVVGKFTPSLWHDSDEIRRHADKLTSELGYSVCPCFDVFTARPRRDLPEEGEWTFIRKDGSRLPVNLSVTALRDAGGTITGFVGLIYDLSERKRNEAALAEREREFRTLTENHPDGIIRFDTDGRHLYINASARRISGTTEMPIIGKTICELDLPGNPAVTQPLLNALLKVVATGQADIVEFEWPNGRVSEMRYIAETNERGEVVSVLAIARDISERKQLEAERLRYRDELEDTVQRRTEQLRLACEAAETANKAKSTFLANMNHELRTPLNSILGFSDMLLNNTGLEDKVRRNLEIIKGSGEHLLGLINHVLEMAKIEAGRMQLVEAPFNLPNMMDNVVRMMQVRAAEKHLRIEVELSPQLPCYIVGDEARLRQVIINLVNNAVKFTDQGGVKVCLGTHNNSVSHLIIEVSDTGPGIDAEDQQRIFEPFVQLGQLSDSKGTGLGLSIARQFVQLMGGTISVESKLGQGALFRVKLPLHLAAGADIDSRQQSELNKRVIGLVPGQQPRRVLIAENDRENLLLLAELMAAIGFDLKEAGDGQQAIDLFRSWRPHLIWMDYQMPVMDGIKATRMIRGLPGGAEVKIVAVTASAFAEQREEMLAAGMDDFVSKPYRADEIYSCLARQLGVTLAYADNASDSLLAHCELSQDALRALPPDVLGEIEAALVSLDAERIERGIELVAVCDRELAETLTQFASRYDYPAILKALRNC